MFSEQSVDSHGCVTALLDQPGNFPNKQKFETWNSERVDHEGENVRSG